MAKVQTQLLLDPPVWGRLNIVAAAAGIVRAEAARRAIEGKGLPALEREYAEEIEALRVAGDQWGIPLTNLAHQMLTNRVLAAEIRAADSFTDAVRRAQDRHSRGRVVPA